MDEIIYLTFTANESKLLFEVVTKWYEKRAVMLPSNLLFGQYICQGYGANISNVRWDIILVTYCTNSKEKAIVLEKK